MSTSSNVCLGALRLAAQEESDNESNPAVATETWNQFITNSYKELYDMLVGAYGNNYHFATAYQFTTSNPQAYALPDGSPNFINVNGSQSAKFYKALGVDLQYSSSPSGWVSLTRLNFEVDRNKYSYPNTVTSWYGTSNLRYSIQGNNIYLTPPPQTGQLVRLWYVPAPTNLQYRLPASTVGASNVIGSFTDTTGVRAGMNITGLTIPDNTIVTAVASTTLTISNNALSGLNSVILSIWDDGKLVDGISGWEEFVIVDAAIKAQGKQENDASMLIARRDALKVRIEAMAEARDAGQAFHVSDTLGMNSCGDMGDGWGQDGGFY